MLVRLPSLEPSRTPGIAQVWLAGRNRSRRIGLLNAVSLIEAGANTAASEE